MNKITGLKTNHLIRSYKSGTVRVYTDRQNANRIIQNVPGVTNVFSEQIQKSEHHVYIDPRYDRRIVIQNIKRVLKPESIKDIIGDYERLHPRN